MQHSEINWKLSFIQRMYRDDAVLHLCAALKWKIYSRMRFEPIFEAMVKAVVASQSYITSCCNMRSVCGEQTRFFSVVVQQNKCFPFLRETEQKRTRNTQTWDSVCFSHYIINIQTIDCI